MEDEDSDDNCSNEPSDPIPSEVNSEYDNQDKTVFLTAYSTDTIFGKQYRRLRNVETRDNLEGALTAVKLVNYRTSYTRYSTPLPVANIIDQNF